MGSEMCIRDRLWRWSNDNPENFWESIVEYFNIYLEKKKSFKAYNKKNYFWNSTFFKNCNLNYYDLISKNNSSDTAIEFIGENKFKEIKIKHINNRSSSEISSNLLKYDSIHGKFRENIKFGKNFITIGKQKISFSQN